MAKFLETRKDRIVFGLACLSGGGMLITQAHQRVDDPTLQSVLTFLLVFWVILTARLTYSFGWLHKDMQAGQIQPAGAGAALRVPAARAAVRPPKEGSGSDGDNTDDNGAGKPRRRRTRRD